MPTTSDNYIPVNDSVKHHSELSIINEVVNLPLQNVTFVEPLTAPGEGVEYRVTIPNIKNAGNRESDTGDTSARASMTSKDSKMVIYDKITSYIRLTQRELLYDITNRMKLVYTPLLKQHMASIDAECRNMRNSLFSRNVSGVRGQGPEVQADFTAARTKILKAVQRKNLQLDGVFTADTLDRMQNLIVQTSSDYQRRGPENLRDGEVSNKFAGINPHRDNAADFTPVFRLNPETGLDDEPLTGKTADGAALTGSTKISIQGFTNATRTFMIYKGAEIAFDSIAGQTFQVISLRNDCVTNKVTDVEFYPALPSDVADDEGISFQTLLTADCVFNRSSFGFAAMPGCAADKETVNFGIQGLPSGYGISYTEFGKSELNEKKSIGFSSYIGVVMAEDAFGCICQKLA